MSLLNLERDEMSKKGLKIAGISILGILAVLYVLFLAAPLFVNLYLKSHNAEIVKMIEDASGFKVVLSEIKLVTTPKLTAGVKFGHTEAAPEGQENIFSADGFDVRLSLIPLIAKRIELDKISVKNAKIFLAVKKDGHFVIEDCFKSQPAEPSETPQASPAGLPFGLKLSNRLPNVYLTKTNIEFYDREKSKRYYFEAEKFNLTDFVFNKKVKIVSNGAVYLDETKHFSYDVKVRNHIMPNCELHDIVFPSNVEIADESAGKVPAGNTSSAAPLINIIDIFEAIHTNMLAADLQANVETYGTLDDFHYSGFVNIDGITIAVDGKTLPKGVVNVELNHNKAKISASLHPASNESLTLLSDIKTGKNPQFSAHVVSNAGINNIINLLDSVAKSFGIEDLDSLSGTGNIDANFSVTGDKKKITSSGYFKIPSASLNYRAFNVLIDKIKSDIDFSDNNVNIKDVSFTVFNQPLRFYGKISNNAEADLHLTAEKLLIKALVAAAGQLSLLKENDFKSGTLSMEAILQGRLSAPVPSVSLSVDNLNIKNIPSNMSLKLKKALFDITTEEGAYEGLLNIEAADIVSPFASVKAPRAEVTVNEKDITIDSAYVLVDNSRIDLSGSINDYADSEDVSININANGNLVASDLLSFIPADFRAGMSAKGKLPLKVAVTGNFKQQLINANLGVSPDNYVSILDIDLLKNKSAEIKSTLKIADDTLKIYDTGLEAEGVNIAAVDGAIYNLSKTQNMSINLSVPSYVSMPVPMMGKNSKIKLSGDLNVGGTPLNPTLKGNVSIPLIDLPDMVVKLENLDINLNGLLAKGKGTLEKLTSGGIVAENLSSDFTFNPANGVFYLKNISGTAFKGDLSGNVSYNILNGKIGVDLKGSGLDAVSAIQGAAGIKNALTGTLDFSANVTTSGVTDVDMIKNLKGNASFEIRKGAFAGIGRIESLLSANNIMSNVILKAAVAALSSVPVIKESANFDYLKGAMTFNGGWANISSITSSGANVAYYISGKYNILNGTANVIILGRLSADVVAALGPLGELSVDKLTSYIPKFGALTASIIKTVTSNPAAEKTENIPSLSGGDTVYKDFKVEFNGGVESSSSVKSFKWLNNPDMSAIETTSLKEQVQSSTENLKQNIKTGIEAAKEKQEQTKQDLKDAASAIKQQSQQTKEDIKNQVQNVKDSVNEIMNLFKKPSAPAQTPASTTEAPDSATTTAPAAAPAQ